MFKKMIVAGVFAAVLMPAFAQAQDKPADKPADQPASPHTFTGNVGLYSQYIFRGLTQTNGDPALQGGFDYSHSSGWYAGTWASNISWLKENASANGFFGPGVNAIAGTYQEGGSLEWDFYAGYKWGFAPDWTLDLGTLYYWYPGKTSLAYDTLTRAAMAPNAFGGAPKADTWEIYGALSWKWLSAKYSRSVQSETFGTLDSNGTYYLDLSANIPLGDLSKDLNGFTVMLHWGMQKYSGTDPRNVLFSRTLVAGAPYATTPDNDEIYSYHDWKIGLSYALPKDFTIGGYYTKVTSDNRLGYGSVNDRVVPGFFGPYPKDIGRSAFTAYIQKTF